MTPAARRVMALLVGLHYQDRKPMERWRLAEAIKRSERTVKRALAELRAYGWISFTGGGNGTPGTIRVINDKAWIMAPVSKMAPDQYRNGPGLDQDGPGLPRIRALEVLQGKERGLPLPSPVEKTDFEELERLAIAHGLPLSCGADIDAALRIFERKPPRRETGEAGRVEGAPVGSLGHPEQRALGTRAFAAGGGR